VGRCHAARVAYLLLYLFQPVRPDFMVLLPRRARRLNSYCPHAIKGHRNDVLRLRRDWLSSSFFNSAKLKVFSTVAVPRVFIKMIHVIDVVFMMLGTKMLLQKI